MLEHNIDIIYNADQTGVNYESLSTKTLNPNKEDTVWIKCGGNTKERATAILLDYKVHGQDDCPRNFTLRNGFGKTVWMEVQQIQGRNGCQIYGNPSAWWNSDLSLAFLKFHFDGRRHQTTKMVLLLWDDFSAHFTDDIVAYAKSINVILERVPPRFTWIWQPADVVWILPLEGDAATILA
ncbi:Aste57867_20056 [Aphanomyces stellatus]|uniref:Aste57867_20056 protein n=1 Tax=Aphanomyces stellatus TaxID=120398 RepID=A0A485LEP3_9STRA|nr:hypothetical protein As57867_019990 [Aphanomyces stellatus]VFT96752.1 Aste57867_20056 [Aphanomyces stellatus]